MTSDFSLLLLIASIVWTASCGKRSTGYYTQIYYPWQTKWDEKREIIVKEPLPQDGIAQSLQEGWFPSDWSTLRNSSCALVVRRSPVTSPPPVCVCVFECMAYCVWGRLIVWTCMWFAWLILVSLLFLVPALLLFPSRLQWFSVCSPDLSALCSVVCIFIVALAQWCYFKCCALHFVAYWVEQSEESKGQPVIQMCKNVAQHF